MGSAADFLVRPALKCRPCELASSECSNGMLPIGRRCGSLSIGATRRVRAVAQTRYVQFVAEGIRAPSPWRQLKAQVFLGNEQFVEQTQAHLDKNQRRGGQIPIAHRRPPAPTLTKSENTTPLIATPSSCKRMQRVATHISRSPTTSGYTSRRREGSKGWRFSAMLLDPFSSYWALLRAMR